jgi:hypothetical protein
MVGISGDPSASPAPSACTTAPPYKTAPWHASTPDSSGPAISASTLAPTWVIGSGLGRGWTPASSPLNRSCTACACCVASTAVTPTSRWSKRPSAPCPVPRTCSSANAPPRLAPSPPTRWRLDRARVCQGALGQRRLGARHYARYAHRSVRCAGLLKIDVEGGEFDALRGLSYPLKALSFEYIPATVDVALACVQRLGELGRYGYNWAPSEPRSLRSSVWVGPVQMADLLRRVPVGGGSGDVYARRLD